MARFKLVSDILSPLHSDISLNDISAFSFGSLTSTPDNDKDFMSPIDKCIEKDSDINSLCKRTMTENDEVFEGIVKDINAQSNINTKREAKFKESYKMLKQSMDELYTKPSYSSILSPISKDAEFENGAAAQVTDSKLNLEKIDEDPQNAKIYKSATSRPKTGSQISSKEIENTKKESSNSVNKVQRSQLLKNIQPLKLSANNIDAKLINSHKPKTSKGTTLSTQTTKSFEAKRTKSKEPHKEKELQRSKPVKAFPFKSQQKIAVSNTLPGIEDKSLSIEKSIQIAVGIEMDNLRCFILDQNLRLNKELLKLQDMARKQTEVTGHLFSLVDELLEANMKLISKQKVN